MFSRLALVDSSNLVVNVIKGDPGTFKPPEGITAVKDDAGLADVGGTYVGGVFSPPVVVPPQPVDLDALDLANLNAALAHPGSVVRGLALAMLDEINALRTQAGLAARTQTQLRDAIKAKMR